MEIKSFEIKESILQNARIIFKNGRVTKFTVNGKKQSKISINGIEMDLPANVSAGDYFGAKKGDSTIIEFQ